MSGWLDLTQLGLAPNQKHQALLGAPKIVHCGEHMEFTWGPTSSMSEQSRHTQTSAGITLPFLFFDCRICDVATHCVPKIWTAAGLSPKVIKSEAGGNNTLPKI